jgi:hypothetical protein
MEWNARPPADHITSAADPVVAGQLSDRFLSDLRQEVE